MSVEQTIRVIGEDGEAVVAEVVKQDGGNAAAIRVRDENWHTPATLREIGAACNRMASMIEAEA